MKQAIGVWKKSFFKINMLLTGLLLISITGLPQDFSRIKIRTFPLAENIYVLVSGAGGNMIVMTGKDGVILVDSDFAQLSEKIAGAIGKLSPQPVKYLINTHWHFDHTGGNEYFARKGCHIIAHQQVKARMSRNQTIALLNVKVKASPKIALPATVFTRNQSLSLNGENILLLHLPNAHTDGDCCVYFKHANILHTGDLVFNHSYPFIDLSSGGSISGMIKGLDTMLNLCNDQTVIVPGHGPFLNKKRMEAYRGMLSEFREAVAEEIRGKKNLAEVQQSVKLKRITDKWGYRHFPPRMFIKMVYLSLNPGSARPGSSASRE